MPAIALALAAGIVWASVIYWSRVFRSWRSGRDFLTGEPSPGVPWGLVDIAMALGIWLAGNLLAAAIGQEVLQLPAGTDLRSVPDSAQIPILWIGGFSSLVICLLIALAMFARHRVTAAELGWDSRTLRDDLALGGKAFVMLAPLVYGLQLLLTQLVESKHPLLEMLKRNPDPELFLVAGFGAIIVAPLTEEFLFRVLLLGWLERLFAPDSHGTERLIYGGRTNAPPMRLPPLLLSSAFFALAHWSHGPDPIPLFLLAMGLGYLYMKTHRIMPCVVVHFLLNLCSLAALGLSVAD